MRFFLVPLFILIGWLNLFSPALSCLAAESPAAENAFREGLRLKEAGSYREAEGQFKVALGLDPGNANYHFELANLYALRYDISQKISKNSPDTMMLNHAARELEQTLMIRPDFLAARYNLGVVYKRQRRFEKAREAFRKVQEAEPQQANAVLQIGATYEEQGFFDDAKSFYEKARELNYTDPSSQGVLEDLRQHQEEAKQKEQLDRASRIPNLGDSFGFTPFSQAAGYQQDRETAANSGGGLQQALPYLGSWLVGQFMKSRNSEQE